MTKAFITKKQMVVSIVIIAIAIIAYAVSKMHNPSIGFAYFEPSYLPPSVSVKEKRISITRGYVAVEQNFRTEDWVYSIREDSSAASSSVGTANQDYDPKSVKPTCNVQKTSAQMQYRLCHWVDYGRIDVHEVIFIKDNTRIYSQIPSKTDQNISVDQIEKYIDSFQQKNTLGFPVLRSNGA